MKEARPALRYAKALLNLAKSNGIEEEVNNNLKLVVATINDSEDLDAMLKSPVIKISEKKNALNAIFGDKVNNVTKGLFEILADNKRISILDVVAKQYSVIFDYDKSIQTAKVTTAVALTKELEQKIQDKIVALTGHSAGIENIIDPSIIGGFVLRVGDIQYDASISNKFKELEKEFDNDHYISKI